jgi:hypothetical protein
VKKMTNFSSTFFEKPKGLGRIREICDERPRADTVHLTFVGHFMFC